MKPFEVLLKEININQAPAELNLANYGTGESKLDTEKAEALSEALVKNTSISSLDISFNPSIESMGLRAIATALKKNKSITSINLSDIGDKLDTFSAKALAEAFQDNNTLTSIDLSGNNVNSEFCWIIFDGLKQNKKVHSIDLSCNSLGSSFGKHLYELLESNKSLAKIKIINTKLDLQSLRDIAEALKLTNTITAMDLGNNALGPDCGAFMANILKHNHSLTDIGLWMNNLGSEAGILIIEALHFNKTLTVLDLSSNKLNPIVGKCIAGLLKVNNTLTSLNLENNDIGYESTSSIFESLHKNKTLTLLNLANTNFGPNSGKFIGEALKENSTLTSLSLDSNASFDKEWSKYQMGPLDGQWIAEGLKANKTLTSISLWGNSLGPEGGQHIAKALKTNKSIVSINLLYNNIKPESNAQIQASLAANNELKEKMHNKKMNMDAKKQKSEQEKTKPKQPPNFKVIFHIEKKNEELENKTKMKAISNRKIDLKAAREIFNTLKANKQINTVIFWNNDIDTEAANFILKELKSNNTITSLDISNNRLGIEYVTFIFDLLSVNKTLISLSAGYNDLSSGKEYLIAKAIDVNKTLRTLDLEYCNLKHMTMTDIAAALLNNKTLTSIKLKGNAFNTETFPFFKKVLKTNVTLTSMSFGKKNYSIMYCQRELIDALKHNRTIIDFELTSININTHLDTLIENKRFIMSVAAIIKRNLLLIIQKEIMQLFPDTPLVSAIVDKGDSSSEVIENKHVAEDFDIKQQFESIEAKLQLAEKAQDKISPGNPAHRINEFHQKLEKTQEFLEWNWLGTIIELCKEEALLAYCSWDSHAALPAEERISKLEGLIRHILIRERLMVLPETIAQPNDNSVIKPFINPGKFEIIKLKALSLLARIYENLGMIKITENQLKLADEYLLSAYSCGLHGIRDKETLQTVSNALSLWIDKRAAHHLEYNRKSLEEELAQSSPDKFKQLQKAYKDKCSQLVLTPLSHLQQIQQPLIANPVIFSQNLQNIQSIRGLDVEADELPVSTNNLSLTDKRA